MAITLSEVFDKHFKHVKFNNKLAKAIYIYQIEYVNRNREHLEFFGGNLIGVQVVRFKDSDVNKFYDLLDIDYVDLTNDVRKVDTINHDFKVSGDVLNLTSMYIIHKFLTSNELKPIEAKRAAYDMALIFFYRCIVAILSAWIRYPIDPKIAQASFARLSNKHLIKRLGSWNKVMDYRATDLTSVESVHYKALVRFNDDQEIVYAINDSQGRIRDMLKNYYAEFKKAHTEGENIGTTSGTAINAEGEEALMDRTKPVDGYINYMRTAILDRHTFIKNDLMSVITKINTNTSLRIIKHTLEWMVDNTGNAKYSKRIDDFMVKVIIQSMHFINNNIDTLHDRDYPHILASLKNLYLSTRSVDADLVDIRELGADIIKDSNGDISTSLMLSTRTSIILYITLRAITGSSKGKH